MKTILRSNELNCPSCVNNIEANLNNIDGVRRARVHFSTGRIEVEHEAEKVKPETLIKAVREAGYESELSPF